MATVIQDPKPRVHVEDPLAERKRAACESVLDDYNSGLIAPVHHGLESDIVDMFMATVRFGLNAIEPVPLNPEVDTIIKEMAFKYGRADIVIFHVDGTATVIEVKDGTKGYNHVVAGIGQASLYAQQVYAKGSVTSVRRALLWTSAGSVDLDRVICEVCAAANVVAIPWASLAKHKAIWNESVRRVTEVLAEAAQ